MNYNYFIDISSWFFLVFLTGTVLHSFVTSIIDWTNKNKGDIGKKLKEAHKTNPLMKKFFSIPKMRKIEKYNSTCTEFEDMTSSVSSSFTTLAVMLGLSPFVLHTIIENLPSLSTTWHYVIFFLFVNIVKTVVSIPSEYYQTFKIEEDFGFNRMSRRMFFIDTLKGFLMSSAISTLGIVAINYILTTFGPFSTTSVILFTLGVMAVGMGMEFLYMTVFIRFFNKLEPLKDGKLKRKIASLVRKYGYSAERIFVMDESKRSTKANAFIGGIGKSRKIVLFDTLLKNYSDDEIVAILGHELAHGRLHHLALGRIMSFMSTLLFTAVAFSLTYNPNLYHAFGYVWINETNVVQYSMLGLSISMMVMGSISWILTPLNSFISRKCEYAADRYSVKYTKKRDAMISSLIKLTSENCGDLFPSKAYETYNYSHPSLLNRINALKNTEKKIKNKDKKTEKN